MDMQTTFRNPVRPGRIAAHGWVANRVGDVASLAAELTRADGAVIATATATARVIPLPEAAAAP
jgi:acyl-coenzyme A thioesterase PaaI-like protein